MIDELVKKLVWLAAVHMSRHVWDRGRPERIASTPPTAIECIVSEYTNKNIKTLIHFQA